LFILFVEVWCGEGAGVGGEGGAGGGGGRTLRNSRAIVLQ